MEVVAPAQLQYRVSLTLIIIVILFCGITVQVTHQAHLGMLPAKARWPVEGGGKCARLALPLARPRGGGLGGGLQLYVDSFDCQCLFCEQFNYVYMNAVT